MRKQKVDGFVAFEPETIPERVEPEHIPDETESKKMSEAEERRWDVFPEDAMVPFRGLLFVGAIEREVEFAGHRFLLKTLNEGEVLRVGQLVSDWQGTLGQAEAQRVYLVAASIQRLDGRPLVEPISGGTDLIYDKAQILKTWYPPVVRHLFGVYQDMERTSAEVAVKLGGPSGS